MLSPNAASADLAARLRTHMHACAGAPDSDRLEQAARHIETTLAAQGYQVREEAYDNGPRNIEVSIANVATGAQPERIFIFGAHYGCGNRDDGSASAFVLELAHLLQVVQPAQGTELKFVFLPPGAAGRRAASGNFVAFVGDLETSRAVRQELSVFRAADLSVQGLAVPAYVQGVTWSDPLSNRRHGYPAMMVTGTTFLRYPYQHLGASTPDKTAGDKVDYADMARTVEGVARTIAALAGGTRT
ncbi:hypothetical protein [Massilia horti]|uniref:Peptidase M28 domain-containing protein n=1 Tax=Massilia horti TaxID=2562153 RepID=A0A4Y9SSV4_9BURK|nr:hypothetical protein [Massilia horti]TFW29528.1 hypothetical protein E4O92_18450 [Massilia horti]